MSELDLCDLSSCQKKTRDGSGRKKKEKKLCRTIEDGLGGAFDSKWLYVS